VISDKIGFLENPKIRVGIFSEIEEQRIDLVVKKDFSDTFVKVIEPQLVCLHPTKLLEESLQQSAEAAKFGNTA
jgi:hypothetical protein